MSPTTTNESDNGVLSKDQSDSSSVEEGNSKMVGGGNVLKKGPWTAAEDAILIDYVKKHGEGNWNAVQKHSGLFRCGKSCRLRWANHLRPNLKKGAFTAEEERLIIELHAKMGNKWARMAAHLPGRTDNEIKNYWNTRIKRRQRAGLPLYPPDVSIQGLNEDLQNKNDGELQNGVTNHNDLLQPNNYDIPAVYFNNLKASTGALRYSSAIHNVSMNSMLNQGLGSSQSFSFRPAALNNVKHPPELETLASGFSSCISNNFTWLGPFKNSSLENIHQPLEVGVGLPYDPDPDIMSAASYGAVMTGSHSLVNGNFSASKPFAGFLKTELPSLQYPVTDSRSGGECHPPTPLEAADAYIQCPLSPPVQMQSESISPRNSGLLEALVHEAQALGSSKIQSSENSSFFPVLESSPMVDSSSMDLCEGEWEYRDQVSPLGNSVASSVRENTPISSSSMDDSTPSKLLLGSEVKAEIVEHLSSTDDGEKIAQLDFSRPDTLLGADFFARGYEYVKDLVSFLGEDLLTDSQQMTSGTSAATQGWRN